MEVSRPGCAGGDVDPGGAGIVAAIQPRVRAVRRRPPGSARTGRQRRHRRQPGSRDAGQPAVRSRPVESEVGRPEAAFAGEGRHPDQHAAVTTDRDRHDEAVRRHRQRRPRPTTVRELRETSRPSSGAEPVVPEVRIGILALGDDHARIARRLLDRMPHARDRSRSATSSRRPSTGTTRRSLATKTPPETATTRHATPKSAGSRSGRNSGASRRPSVADAGQVDRVDPLRVAGIDRRHRAPVRAPGPAACAGRSYEQAEQHPERARSVACLDCRQLTPRATCAPRSRRRRRSR